jgi:hypothetical protein
VLESPFQTIIIVPIELNFLITFECYHTYRVFKCNVSVIARPLSPLFCSPLAIPDDAMDVDRVVDEDKDNDPDKVKKSNDPK